MDREEGINSILGGDDDGGGDGNVLGSHQSTTSQRVSQGTVGQGVVRQISKRRLHNCE